MKQCDLKKENYSAIVPHFFLLKIYAELEILMEFSYILKPVGVCAISMSVWISWFKKHTLVNFQDQRSFETEVIKEKVVFKISAEAHQFAIS